MQYMLLIYMGDRADSGEPSPGTPEYEQLVQDYRALSQEVKDKGIMLGADPLEPVSTASTVRVRNGKTETTDGPFAETKETLGGYYLLDCKDLDEAIDYAARIPTTKYESIEIRPIMATPFELR